ncbi:MAG: alkaline phosphatase D family protein [Flavobacteriales bacterium]|nr:alkaline phosphatase D family protein [Flavobacteriales bacterium]MCB9190776.1 alkaline phosphatase D family protein [Flavobacteriales bacterium]
MKHIFLFPLCFFSLSVLAQSITSGPVVGGLTSESARIYIRTDVPTTFEIELDTLESFATSFTVSDSTRSDHFSMVITDVEGLEPFKDYFYRFLINGQPQDSVYNFTSFPEVGDTGHYKIVVGSCNYFENFELFGHIKEFNPMLFIHLGDWGYPATPFGWDFNLYPDRIANAFSWCYNDANMSRFVLGNSAIDYVYDDSYCYNGNQGNTFPQINTVELAPDSFFYDLQTIEFDSAVITGAINGYFDQFPGYAPVDTTVGIYHSFTLGNIEFFMLDLRNPASPQNDPFIYHPETNTYTFEPDSNHSLMSAPQREWLLNGLQNSTADWKVIGSSVMFNKRFTQFLNIAVQLQVLSPSLVEYAWSLAYLWAAYPVDLNGVLDFVEENNIKDVIVISGDSHSSMVDDGTNAGLPELSASGLASQDEGYLNHSLDSVIDLLGYSYGTIDSLWNGGGSGVDNTNFSDSYGTMEFFGRDSVMLCAHDETGQTLGCVRLYHSTNPLSVWSTVSSNRSTFRVYPNPTNDQIQLELFKGFLPTEKTSLELFSPTGQLIQIWNGPEIQNRMVIDLSGHSAGSYSIVLRDGNRMDSKSVVVSR